MHRLKARFTCNNCGTRFVAYDPVSVALHGLSAVFVVIFVGTLLRSVSEPTSDQSLRAAKLEAEASEDALSASASNAINMNLESLKTSASEGDSDAQYRLAMALFREYKISGDSAAQTDAIVMLRDAANNGHSSAQSEMGDLFFEGRGVVQDFVQASDWYKKAASQGYAEAMYGLGKMSRSGWGMEVSLVDAYVWLNLASARGESRALQARQEVLSQLSSTQLADAQLKSRELDKTIP
ncbi:tetratricopeptide repeat protein [Congregibacter brevis]|uniref:Tetratricopeptide repeat protein n=1 Tax=Congregibacter brevis TaxID=3081201 RepID=A0ABZ0ICN9_9GAMM|nr:tetratricopeptide repeat protein [Congregibacter sp. IMCC45268]